MTLLCVKVTGPALHEYHNDHVARVWYVHRLRRNRKIINSVLVEKANVFVLM